MLSLPSISLMLGRQLCIRTRKLWRWKRHNGLPLITIFSHTNSHLNGTLTARGYVEGLNFSPNSIRPSFHLPLLSTQSLIPHYSNPSFPHSFYRHTYALYPLSHPSPLFYPTLPSSHSSFLFPHHSLSTFHSNTLLSIFLSDSDLSS